MWNASPASRSRAVGAPGCSWTGTGRCWRDPGQTTDTRQNSVDSTPGAGNAFLSNYGAALVAKYLWLRGQDAGAGRRCRYALYGKDYLLFRLTGAHMTDWSSGPDAACWDSHLFEDFGLPANLLPEPALPWHIAGPLTAEAAREMGLPAGTPVAVGAHDGICANVGADAARPGDYAITLGTHAVTRAVTAERPPGAYRFYAMPLDRHVIGGNAILGGRSLDWLLDLTHGPAERDHAYRAAQAQAELIPAGADGVSFLPFLAGQVAPEARPAGERCVHRTASAPRPRSPVARRVRGRRVRRGRHLRAGARLVRTAQPHPTHRRGRGEPPVAGGARPRPERAPGTVRSRRRDARSRGLSRGGPRSVRGP